MTRRASRLLGLLAGFALAGGVACADRIAISATPEPTASSTSAPAATAGVEATSVPRRAPVVALDPGHAVDESGAAAYGVVEKDSNLDMAMRVETLLRARGVEVVLTRHADVRAAPPGEQPTGEWGYNGTRLDLQARVDLANAFRADAFVSLHSNGAGDSSVRGHEVYYNSARPFADENRALARLLLDGVTAELSAGGYSSLPRGAIDDDCLKAFQGRCFPLFVLGPSRVTHREEVYRRGGTPEGLGFVPGQETLVSRPTQMPGALVELLFISSPEDAALLRDEGARDAMARGVARGIVEFLGQSKRGG